MWIERVHVHVAVWKDAKKAIEEGARADKIVFVDKIPGRGAPPFCLTCMDWIDSKEKVDCAGPTDAESVGW